MREAKRRGMTVIGICDTNVDPMDATIAIPANDDAVKSIEFITTLMGEAVKEGRKLAATMPKPEPKGKPGKKDGKKPAPKPAAKPVAKEAPKKAAPAPETPPTPQPTA